MQNNIETNIFKKLKSTYLSTGIATDILEIKKFFGLIILMGNIYKPNTLNHRLTDSM